MEGDLDDAERDAKADAQASLERARERAARREKVQNGAWEMFEKLREKAIEMLAYPIGRRNVTEHDAKGREIAVTVEPVRWRFSDLARLADLADELGRLATGLPSKVTGLSDPEGKPFLMPTQAVAPRAVVIRVERDAESDAEVELYGERKSPAGT